MKKFLTVLAAVLVSATLSMAQNTTRMGSEHKLTYGAALSHCFAESAVADMYKSYNSGFLSLDINSSESNYRTRISLGWLERTHFSPTLSGDAQYLLPIAETGLYFYPSGGISIEGFHKEFNFGSQAALGLEYQFNSFIGLFAESKFQHLFIHGGVNRLSIVGGIKFAF